MCNVLIGATQPTATWFSAIRPCTSSLWFVKYYIRTLSQNIILFLIYVGDNTSRTPVCSVQITFLLGSPPLSSFRFWETRDQAQPWFLRSRFGTAERWRPWERGCKKVLPKTIRCVLSVIVYMKYLLNNVYPNQQWFIRSLTLTDRYNQFWLRRNRTVSYSRYRLELACNRG